MLDVRALGVAFFEFHFQVYLYDFRLGSAATLPCLRGRWFKHLPTLFIYVGNSATRIVANLNERGFFLDYGHLYLYKPASHCLDSLSQLLYLQY